MEHYGLEVPKSKWLIPPKVVENDRAEILQDFQIHTDKQVMANQPHDVVVNKLQKKTAVIVIPSDKKKKPMRS